MTYANLSNACLSGAIAINAYFGGNIGLTVNMKEKLKQRGAIFGDRPLFSIQNNLPT
ncbi:MAG: hypothetical protein RM021_016330 [Nostoc sp. EkiNYC01]